MMRSPANLLVVLLFLGSVLFSSHAKALSEDESEFMAARNLKASNPKEALERLKKLSQSETELKEYILYEMSDLVPESEQDQILQEILRMSPNLLLKLMTIHRLSLNHIEHGRPHNAENLIVSILKRSKGTELHSKLLVALLRAQLHQKKTHQACTQFATLFTKYADHEEMNHITADPQTWVFDTKSLSCSISNEQYMARWKTLILKGYKDKALADWNLVANHWAKEFPYQSVLVKFSFLNADSDFLKAFDVLKSVYKDKKNDQKYLAQLAYASARIGQGAQAVGIFARIRKIAPTTPEGRDAFFQEGFFQYLFQDYDGADRVFNQYLQQNRAPRRKEAEWYLAWMKYLRNDYQSAEKSMSALLGHTKDPRIRERLLYWRGVSLIKMNSAEGEKILETIANDQFSFYGIAATERLRNLRGDKFSPTASKSANEPKIAASGGSDSETDQEDPADKEVTENEDGASTEVVQSESEEVFSDAILYKKLNRAKTLSRIGLQDWARWDLWDVEKRSRSSDQLRKVMRDYQNYGFYNRSSQMAHLRFMQERLNSGLDQARWLWELAYPRAYMSYIKDNSERFEVPPHLIWAIMKQESQFKSDARSQAGAIGLLQIMPFTGVKLAGLLKENKFTPQSLLDPNTNIRLGTKYLSRLSERFSQVVPLVAAAYNAGPHRVMSWMSHFGYLTTDEFIEHIPFSETRLYVKKVMENMWTYEQLYGKKEKLFPYLAQTIPINVTKGFYVAEYWDQPE
jgi:soluble lytic murein transglycosylase